MNIVRFLKIMKRTGLTTNLMIFISFYIISSVLIYFVEPGINKVSDAFWYTFVASTSIGFGDFYPVTHIGRIITVLFTIYEIVIAAMIPGVIVSYYYEFLKIKEKETISTFLEKLERLPELSKEELIEISVKIKQINK